MAKHKPNSQLQLPEVGPTPSGKPELLAIPARVDNWDDYFLHVASVLSIKSKDPRCAVGAVIVSQDHVILSAGFNGFARGVYDDMETLSNADEKIKVICHAELNAIVNAARVGVRIEGATIYVSKFPCISCCNAIIQAGLKRLATHDPEYWKDDPLDKDHSLKRRVLRETHIEVYAPYHPEFTPKTQITVPKRKPGPVKATAARAAITKAG